MFPTVKNADFIIEKSFKIMSKIFKRQLRIKNAEKLNFEKKILNLPQQLDTKRKFSGVWITLWGVSPGHPGQLLLLIFDILKRKIQNLPVLPLKTCAQ